MAVSAERLAAELAARLNEVVPTGCGVRSVGALVLVDSVTGERAASGAASIAEDEDGRDLGERLEVAATAVLSGVQDTVAVVLAEPWPVATGGAMALPDAVVETGMLQLRYLSDRRPVLELPSIEVGTLSR